MTLLKPVNQDETLGRINNLLCGEGLYSSLRSDCVRAGLRLKAASRERSP